jgi:hypothetical protein
LRHQEPPSREAGVGGAGCAVRGNLWSVQHDVEAVDFQIRDVVWSQRGHRSPGEGRAWKRTRLVCHPDFGSGDPAVAGSADPGFDFGAGGGPARPQNFRARHHHLDRPPGLFCEQNGHRLKIDGRFATEATADFGWNNPDQAFLYREQSGGQPPDAELSLGGAVDRYVSVRAVDRECIVRLYVALMDGRGLELALDDEISSVESRLNITALQRDVCRDIGQALGIRRSGPVRLARRCSISREQHLRVRLLSFIASLPRQDLVLDVDPAAALLP